MFKKIPCKTVGLFKVLITESASPFGASFQATFRIGGRSHFRVPVLPIVIWCHYFRDNLALYKELSKQADIIEEAQECENLGL